VSLDIAIIRAKLESAVAVDAPSRPDRLTVDGLAVLYLAHAEKRFSGRHRLKELANIRQALSPLRLLYGDLHPSAVRPLHLRAARQYWVDVKGNARSTIQVRMERVYRCWDWARSVELIDTTLPRIERLRYGDAPTAKPIEPVELDLFEATMPFVSPIAVIMLRLMLRTAMRPGECCDMRGVDIDLSRELWRYRPAVHKGSHLDKVREVFIGPEARKLVEPHLKPGYLWFTARGNRYTSQLLHNQVMWACKKHDLPAWHPNQLRHSALTLIRRDMGLDAAQAVAGHSRIETTQVYAEKSMELATRAALKFG
jgi:integrase